MPPIDELLRIMARLRDPARGCPWDLEQDFSSISPHTIEEAYEVDEAIARGDLASLRDELGDLLFQVVFQARLAEEQGAFDFERVVESVCEKLVRRHPHIFAGAPPPESAASQVGSWEAIKAAEREAAAARSAVSADPFEGIPRALPALTRSAKIAGRIARLDPGTTADIRSPGAIAAAGRGVAEVAARVDPVIRAAGSVEAAGREDAPSRAERLALIGDGLRAWVELARQLGVDPEQALRLEDDAAMQRVRADARQAGNAPHR